MKQKVCTVINELIERYPQLENCRQDIVEAFNLLKQCYTNGGKVMICGNGGSAADSEHIAGELMKGFLLKRKICKEDADKLKELFPGDWSYLSDNLQGALAAISLVSHSAFITAFANDVADDMVFAQQVYGLGRNGDVLIALSTSGNSKNVVNAVKIAKAFGITTIGLTGMEGGRMNGICNVMIKVPANDTYKVQEYHLPVYHALCAMVEEEFFGL